MTLFLSDLHLGRGSHQATAQAERDAVALLRANEESLLGQRGALYLVGDVFDEFIEYKHLIPKSAPRLVGLLAEWADRGARITYLVGNRDPWHLSFFRDHLGVRVARKGLLEKLEDADRGGRLAYIAHGDQEAIGTATARLRRIARHPALQRLYRMSLPGDTAFALARVVSRRFGSGGRPEPDVADHLETAARKRLRTTPAEIVVHGHSHTAACLLTPGGAYLNTGYWFGARTFGRFHDGVLSLMHWTDTGATTLHAIDLTSPEADTTSGTMSPDTSPSPAPHQRASRTS